MSHARLRVRRIAELRQVDLRAVLTAHDIVRSQVTVKYASLMARRDYIENFHEHLPHEFVIAIENLANRDMLQQRVERRVVEYEVREVLVFVRFMQREYVRVIRNVAMQYHLTTQECAGARLARDLSARDFESTIDRIGVRRRKLSCEPD